MNHNGWLRVLGIIIPFCITLLFFQYLIGEIVGIELFKFDATRTIERSLLTVFSFLITTLFTVWLFVRFVDKEHPTSIGLSFKNRTSDLFLGLGLGLLIMGLGFLILLILGEINFQKFHFDPGELFLMLLLFIMVAIAEEVLFRGYVLKNFMLSFPPFLALIISSLLFSLMHGFNPNTSFTGFTNLFLAGVLLGLPYLYRRNLMFPIALHFSWNFFQSLLGFNVSGSSSYSLIEFKIHQETLLNGGAFGFEGSTLAIVAHLIAIIWIWIYYQSKKSIKPSSIFRKDI
ncbi:protease [Marivirga tractuosa]|nr:protease [Marivirga tractuosa]